MKLVCALRIPVVPIVVQSKNRTFALLIEQGIS